MDLGVVVLKRILHTEPVEESAFLPFCVIFLLFVVSGVVRMRERSEGGNVVSDTPCDEEKQTYTHIYYNRNTRSEGEGREYS